MPRRLSNWLKSYAEHTSISEAPLQFHLWTGVSAIAAVLRRRVWIDLKSFQWVPNFYIVLVGPAGVVTKSTTMRLGYRIVRQVPGVKFGPQSLTWQGLAKALSEATQMVAPPGVASDNLTADRLPMACISCDIGELGTFLKPSDKEMVDFLTDMWDGQKTSWKRILASKEDLVVENPWLNVIGCTTPSWLQNNFDPSMIYGGLMSRCIFIWGERKQKRIAYPDEVVLSTEYDQMEDDLVHDLREIGNLLGPMQINEAARKLGRQWYEEHWDNERPEHAKSSMFDGYWGRKQTHIHKLAMVLSAAESDSLVITEEHLSKAILAVTGAERDLKIVLENVSGHTDVKHLDEILSIIRRNKSITRGTLWKHCIRLMNKDQFDAALQGAVDAGYIAQSASKQGPMYRPVKQVAD